MSTLYHKLEGGPGGPPPAGSIPTATPVPQSFSPAVNSFPSDGYEEAAVSLELAVSQDRVGLLLWRSRSREVVMGCLMGLSILMCILGPITSTFGLIGAVFALVCSSMYFCHCCQCKSLSSQVNTCFILAIISAVANLAAFIIMIVVLALLGDYCKTSEVKDMNDAILNLDCAFMPLWIIIDILLFVMFGLAATVAYQSLHVRQVLAAPNRHLYY